MCKANQLLSFSSCGGYMPKKKEVIWNFGLEQYLMSLWFSPIPYIAQQKIKGLLHRENRTVSLDLGTTGKWNIEVPHKKVGSSGSSLFKYWNNILPPTFFLFPKWRHSVSHLIIRRLLAWGEGLLNEAIKPDY